MLLERDVLKKYTNNIPDIVLLPVYLSTPGGLSVSFHLTAILSFPGIKKSLKN
jgi:hypothetical protein